MDTRHLDSGAIHTYIIPARTVEFCRLNGMRAVTRVSLRSLTHDDVALALERSSGFTPKVTMLLLIHALHAFQVEGGPMTILNPASDDPQLRPIEVYRALPTKIIALMEHVLVEHLLPTVEMAA